MLKAADEDFRRYLSQTVSERILGRPEPRHLEEPRGRFTGRGELLAVPRSVREIAEIVRLCAQAGVGIVPYGGGTGLVAGQLALDGPDPLILSLERMNAIRSVDTVENALVAESGTTLQSVREAAEANGVIFPLKIASQGSARIGGVLSSNAGGAGTLRYGNARALCLGLEAVLPDGTIWHGLTPLRKDNTGYDLRDLLIGAEGTLGIITAASLRLFPRPAKRAMALLAVPNPEAALSLLNLARTQFGGNVSAFELMHRQGFDFISETMPDIRAPFAKAPEWSVLLDIGAPEVLPVEEALERFWTDGMGGGLILDGWLAQSGMQRQDFVTLRDSLPEANRRIGAISSHDISLPLGAVAEFIGQAGPAVRRIGNFRINCFGHVGDGNLHYNVFPPRGHQRGEFDVHRDDIKRRVHDLVHALGGSVAAEHGVGRLKTRDLERYADPAKLSAMRAIKCALDPVGIMNPGAVLR